MQTHFGHLLLVEQKSKLQGPNKQKNAWSEEKAFVIPSYLKALDTPNLMIPDFGKIVQHEWLETDQSGVRRSPRPSSRYSIDKQNSLNAISYMHEKLHKQTGSASAGIGTGSGGIGTGSGDTQGHHRQAALPLCLKENTLVVSTLGVRESQLTGPIEQQPPQYRPVTPQPNLKQMPEVNVSDLAQPQPSGLPQETKTPTYNQ